MAIKKFNAIAGISVGDTVIYEVINNEANVAANNLTVSTSANLGDAANVTITGGSAGFVLTTNGHGGLSWEPAGSGGTGQSGFTSVIKNNFVANGTQTIFFLTEEPGSSDNVQVNIDGLIQQESAFSVSGSTVVFGSPPESGQKIEITVFSTVGLGNDNEIVFNSGGLAGTDSDFTFDSTTDTLYVPNVDISNTLIANVITSNSNITASGGYLTLDTGVIAVSGTTAGIFTTGISNVNIGLSGNVTLGSTSGNVTVRGNLVVNSFASTTSISTPGIVSSNESITVPDTETVIIDSFSASDFRSAKYIIRASSDFGFQSLEVLLIHNDIDSYITIYGDVSTDDIDVIEITSEMSGGNIEVYATSIAGNTVVKLLGTYLSD